jgi:hypothetical protein
MAVYRALRAAAPAAVSVVELWRLGATDVHVHVRWLRLKGHRLAQLQVGDTKEWGWRLVRDAWEGLPASSPNSAFYEAAKGRAHA